MMALPNRPESAGTVSSCAGFHCVPEPAKTYTLPLLLLLAVLLTISVLPSSATALPKPSARAESGAASRPAGVHCPAPEVRYMYTNPGA